MSGFLHYKRSRLHRLGFGLWYSRPGGGIALRGEPSVVSGIFVNTPWGLFGWDRHA